MELPYLTEPETPRGTGGTSISHTVQRHPLDLLELGELVELPYLTQTEAPCGASELVELPYLTQT